MLVLSLLNLKIDGLSWKELAFESENQKSFESSLRHPSFSSSSSASFTESSISNDSNEITFFASLKRFEGESSNLLSFQLVEELKRRNFDVVVLCTTLHFLSSNRFQVSSLFFNSQDQNLNEWKGFLKGKNEENGEKSWIAVEGKDVSLKDEFLASLVHFLQVSGVATLLLGVSQQFKRGDDAYSSKLATEGIIPLAQFLGFQNVSLQSQPHSVSVSERKKNQEDTLSQLYL
eukprot:TRINITY_DN2932_c0_g1_i2.p1 TRINITY_DN2932_c0_g1~~TRINITY_DN2932_c0_g1_i2.p1  ORF type:complete len:232 (+),score=95.59 TRINITY_DN2932_c0_g1_i2:180-875(+)